MLPDNHGQIWTELATLASRDPELFLGSHKDVEQAMLAHLLLTGLAKFPIRRLYTLWNNKNWNSMISLWCQYPLGQKSFSLSQFEWMARGRIDNVRFNIFFYFF